jgi:hypothetical protein
MTSLIEYYYRRLAKRMKNASILKKQILLDNYRIYKLSEYINEQQRVRLVKERGKQW